MNKTRFSQVIVLGLTAALLLTGCGKSDTGLNTAPGDASEFVEEAAPTVATGFGAPLDLGANTTITFQENTAFNPGAYASNYQKGMAANKFDITVENKGSGPLDLANMTISMKSGTDTCVDILDGDNNINGAPTDPLAAGASTTFTYGVGCLTKAGAPLDLTVSLNEAVVAVAGTLK
jgi:major membrane immunogen (membrane-anchored lipoprotein)